MSNPGRQSQLLSRASLSLSPDPLPRYCTVLYCTVLYCTVMYCTLSAARTGSPTAGPSPSPPSPTYAGLPIILISVISPCLSFSCVDKLHLHIIFSAICHNMPEEDMKLCPYKGKVLSQNPFQAGSQVYLDLVMYKNKKTSSMAHDGPS